MSPALALAPLTLAAVLVVSGLAKRPDPQSTQSMMTLLRLPKAVANRPVATTLPWAELGIAALLLTPWRWTFALGAVAAIGLFLAFWVIIARAMTFEPRPSCGCFGRVGDHRVTGKTVARNTILVALAGLTGWLAWRGETGTGLMSRFDGGDWWWLVLAVALAAVAVLVLSPPSYGDGWWARRRARRAMEQQQAAASSAAVTHQHDRGSGHDDGHDHSHDPDLVRPSAATVAEEPEDDGLEDYERRPIPSGVLVDRRHDTTELTHLTRSRAQLLVLVNCWCGPTHEALERLPRWREQLPALDVQMVFGPYPFSESAVPGDLTGIWWDPGHRVYADLEIGPSPGAVLLGADGLTAGGPVNGIEAIEEFVGDIAAQLADAQVEGSLA